MSISDPNRTHELTFEERAIWGECPVCHAADGEPCNGDIGIPLGRTINGDLPKGGAHLARLQRAPTIIGIQPIR